MCRLSVQEARERGVRQTCAMPIIKSHDVRIPGPRTSDACFHGFNGCTFEPHIELCTDALSTKDANATSVKGGFVIDLGDLFSCGFVPVLGGSDQVALKGHGGAKTGAMARLARVSRT